MLFAIIFGCDCTKLKKTTFKEEKRGMKEKLINLLVAASVAILLGIWLLPDNAFALF